MKSMSHIYENQLAYVPIFMFWEIRLDGTVLGLNNNKRPLKVSEKDMFLF
jgi:hypothetical protein